MADKPPALRVSQLDAQELDHEVLHLTKSQLANLFKYFQTGFLGQYDPEVTALIKVLLWKTSRACRDDIYAKIAPTGQWVGSDFFSWLCKHLYTLCRSHQTVGQQLLGVHYSQTRGSNPGQWISSAQKTSLATFTIFLPWLRERLSAILALLRLSAWQQQTEQCVRWAETSLKVAALVNFVVFLRHGVYLSLPERLVGVRASFPHRQSIRQVSFDFMTRELLWHGFSELLLFVLPLISIQRVKNSVLRWLTPPSPPPQSPGQHSRADLMQCVVCGHWPLHPHHIGCTHVFCHYCVASNVKADPGYRCPVCGAGDTTSTGVVTPYPVRLTIGPGHS